MSARNIQVWAPALSSRGVQPTRILGVMPLEWARHYRGALVAVIDPDSGIDPEADWVHLAYTFWAALPEEQRILRRVDPRLGEEDGTTDGDALLDCASGGTS